jgi:hypothetical protein
LLSWNFEAADKTPDHTSSAPVRHAVGKPRPRDSALRLVQASQIELAHLHFRTIRMDDVTFVSSSPDEGDMK